MTNRNLPPIGLLVAMALTIAAPHAWSAERSKHPLFKIERSSNANIVQYDAQTGDDGKLHRKEPVVAYWIRLAKNGEIRDLNWIQRRFAYGFKAKLDGATDTVELDMVADIGRPIMVGEQNGQYRAWMQIDGAMCFADKMYINSSGKGLSSKVHYIEFFGSDMKSGDRCYEKLVP